MTSHRKQVRWVRPGLGGPDVAPGSAVAGHGRWADGRAATLVAVAAWVGTGLDVLGAGASGDGDVADPDLGVSGSDAELVELGRVGWVRGPHQPPA